MVDEIASLYQEKLVVMRKRAAEALKTVAPNDPDADIKTELLTVYLMESYFDGRSDVWTVVNAEERTALKRDRIHAGMDEAPFEIKTGDGSGASHDAQRKAYRATLPGTRQS